MDFMVRRSNIWQRCSSLVKEKIMTTDIKYFLFFMLIAFIGMIILIGVLKLIDKHGQK
jgi:hypothetical protein